MNDTPDRAQLFGDVLRKPAFILWTLILPQLLLLWINLGFWNLVSGEMSDLQKSDAFMVGAFEIVLLAAGAIAFAVLQTLKKGVGWIPALVMILAHSGYLWLFTSLMGQLMPANVPDWILSRSEMVYYQFALIMPGLFYACFRLVSFELRLRRFSDLGISLLTLFLLPLLWFIGISISSYLPNPPVVVAIVFFAGSTIIALLAFLRILLIVYAWVNRVERGRLVLLALAGLAAPIGGLLLNISIPFPYDFQDPWVYILTVLNGLILLLPTPKTTPLRAAVWYLRALAFPFTLYFFVVFLPFLPLSLLAMIAAGAGCLILAPTLLFVMQTRRLFDEGRALIPLKGLLFVVTALVAGILTIPIGYTVRALNDREALMAAVEAVFSRDPDAGLERFNPNAALRALSRLRDRKNGIQPPFIAAYYSRLVFQGMVLPDYKIDAIELALSGKIRTGEKASILDIFGDRRRLGRRFRAEPQPAPDRPPDVGLSAVETISEGDADTLKTTVLLRLRNGDRSQAEYVADIAVPDGVLVTGYWLDVGTNRVPGRIFERKTAAWVYHMIRDARRDPGLLVYRNEHRLKLSVFPFGPHEERVTGIEFAFPAVMDPEVLIGNRAVRLNDSPPSGASEPLRFQDAGSDTLIVPRAALKALPAARRKPYLHFILDCSANAANEAAQYAARIRREAERFPEAEVCRVSAANYETADVVEKLTPPADAVARVDAAVAQARLLPFRGGLCPEYALRQGLHEFQSGFAFGLNGDLMVPVFIVVKADATVPVMPPDLAVCARAVPDAPAWYMTRPDGRLDACAFDGGTSNTVDRPALPDPVSVFRRGNDLAAVPAETDAVLSFRPTDAPVMYYDAAARRFDALTNITTTACAGGYGAAMSLWLDCREAMIRPSILNEKLPAIVRANRELSVMTPLTSFIVVENSAQWKALAIKEKQALGADHALEFDEPDPVPSTVPEPAVWLLLPLALVLLWWRGRRLQPCCIAKG